MPNDSVACELCGEAFGRITSSHLKYSHDTTVGEYSLQFPMASLVCKDWCDEHSRDLGGREFTDNHKAALSRGNRERWKDPVQVQARSELMKSLWKTPDYVQAFFDSIAASNSFPESVDEKILDLRLQNLVPGVWQYNGDGKVGVVVGRKLPDFVRVDRRYQIIELFGPWSHSALDELGLLDYYRELGYGCLILWDTDVYGEETNLLTKVREFTWF